MTPAAPPPFVIVSGAPGAGKTTLARRLSADLRLPLVMKDAVKEILGNTIGAADRERSKELGAASYELLYAVAGWLLDAGTGLVLESNFWRGLSEPRPTELLDRSRALLVHCEADPETVISRFRARGERGERHPVHFDAMELPRLGASLRDGLFEPLDLPVPCLRVVTTDGYDPPYERILDAIRFGGHDHTGWVR